MSVSLQSVLLDELTGPLREGQIFYVPAGNLGEQMIVERATVVAVRELRSHRHGQPDSFSGWTAEYRADSGWTSGITWGGKGHPDTPSFRQDLPLYVDGTTIEAQTYRTLGHAVEVTVLVPDADAEQARQMVLTALETSIPGADIEIDHVGQAIGKTTHHFTRDGLPVDLDLPHYKRMRSLGHAGGTYSVGGHVEVHQAMAEIIRGNVRQEQEAADRHRNRRTVAEGRKPRKPVTDQMRREIIALRSTMSAAALAKRFDVSQGTVHKILRQKDVADQASRT